MVSSRAMGSEVRVSSERQRRSRGEEHAAMLTEAGFTDIEVKPTFAYKSIVTGRKP